MQYITYTNINVNFTFENIYPHVNKYLTNEVINKKHEYTIICLTIIVSTRNNKKYILDSITIRHSFDKNSFISPKPFVFNSFIMWLFGNSNTEIKLPNNF